MEEINEQVKKGESMTISYEQKEMISELANKSLVSFCRTFVEIAASEKLKKYKDHAGPALSCLVMFCLVFFCGVVFCLVVLSCPVLSISLLSLITLT